MRLPEASILAHAKPLPFLPFHMPTGSKVVGYFDGRCGFCRRSARNLHRLDWLGRLEFVDLASIPPADLPVPIEAAMKGMPLRTRGGRILLGFPAIRHALLQTPVGFLPALLMWIPGLSHIAEWVYEWVATHRKRDTCAIHPT